MSQGNVYVFYGQDNSKGLSFDKEIRLFEYRMLCKDKVLNLGCEGSGENMRLKVFVKVNHFGSVFDKNETVQSK